MNAMHDAKVALVSGAGRGLARAVAEALASEGGRVHGMTRNPERRDSLLKVLGKGRVHGGDLREAGSAGDAVKNVLSTDGRLDTLVLGVGPYKMASLEETTADEFADLLQTNVMAAVRLVDAARPALRESEGQVLFFGAAGLGTRPARKTSAAYTVAKTALLAYMRSLALQEAPHGVRVNMLSPGIVPHEGASADTLDPEVWRSIPLGRPGRMEDITEAALWLLSSDHVTGQNLEVAGGFLL